MIPPSRYIVGIDLGTTHCALAYVDTQTSSDQASASPQIFSVSQLVAHGAVEARPLLPSFLYLAHESERPQALPWDPNRAFAVGHYARSRGAEAPGRLVSSAKSWLSHSGVDRRAGILPQGASEDVEKISPVETSFRYLEHLTEAWNTHFAAEDPALTLSQQEVVITVPASFDAAARELTAEAAMCAGIERLTLLEEPQAALYAWLDTHGDTWRKQLRAGDLLLVVDVGGGTTDFSAIAVLEKDGNLELHRLAVGDHILLGGDNMDLSLAYAVQKKLESEGHQMDSWQRNALMHACRTAKEQLLGSADTQSAPVVIAGRGTRLLAGTLRTELTQSDLTRVLVDGFFPEVPAAARPATRARGALTQLGLPYASDAAVTRHLAAFLSKQAKAAETPGTPVLNNNASSASLLLPTALLFNGGVMKGEPLRDRLLSVMQSWLQSEGAPPMRVLEGADLDLAVARGAAVYGYARRGKGIRIRGGTARAYYVGIESSAPAVPGMEPPVSAVCVAPFGMEEGTSAAVPKQSLGLVVGEPVRFRFFGSSVRRDDHVGTELERWSEDELAELPPIEITLPAEGRHAGDVVPVYLSASITEVGTLLLEALPNEPHTLDERWKIELNVRSHEE